MRDSDSPRPDSVKVLRFDIRYVLSRGKGRPTGIAQQLRPNPKADRDSSATATTSSDESIQSTVNENGLWRPETVPVSLFDKNEMARSRSLYFLFGLLATIVVGGLAAVVILSLADVDTQPLLAFLALVCTPTFGAAGYALGHYFGHKEKVSGM